MNPKLTYVAALAGRSVKERHVPAWKKIAAAGRYGRAREAGCVFCEIAAGDAPAAGLRRYESTFGSPFVAFEPLRPVTAGHVLVAPGWHVPDAVADPVATGLAFEVAALVAGGGSCNLIASTGREASQTVNHLHVHVVPRRDGDGLALPWTGQQDRDAAVAERDRLRWFVDKAYRLFVESYVEFGSLAALQDGFWLLEQERAGLSVEDCEASLALARARAANEREDTDGS